MKPNIAKPIVKVAKDLEIPILDPLLEILDAEWSLIDKLKDPNAKEWERIDKWKQEHPVLTKKLEKLVNQPLTFKTKESVVKSIKGVTRGGGVARDKRGGSKVPTQKQYHPKQSKTKSTSMVSQSRPSSTMKPAIKGGKIMASKPVLDPNAQKEWDKKKKRKGKNHPEWYIGKYAPTLVNLNFGVKKVGAVYPEGTSMPTTDAPSVAALGMALTVPTDETYSFGQAIATLYSKLRAVNSGTTVYTVNDLTAYILNVRAIRAVVAQIHRLCKAANMVDIYDSRVPEAIIRGHFAAPSYTAVINNISALRALGAQLDQQSRSMLPLNLPILDRTEWLFNNVFSDSNDVKPQWYLPKISNIRLFNITASNTYSMVNIDLSTVPNVLSVVPPMLSLYLSTYIVNVIAGDMIKAYGDNVIRPLIADWDATATLTPIYDEDILQQIENADVLDWYVNTPIYNAFVVNFDGVSKFTNDLADPSLAQVKWINGVSEQAKKPECGCHIINGARDSVYINSFRDEVTPGQVLSYSRLKFHIADTTMGASDPKVINVARLRTCGSEIIQSISGIVKDSATIWLPTYPTYGVSDVNFYNIAVKEQFDWHPMTYLLSNLYGPAGIGWDFKNFAQISYNDIDKLHQYANYAIVEPRYDFAEQGRWSASRL